jgi:hypothetical protein
MATSIHISERINRNPVEVYRYASNLDNLTSWAQGVTPDMQIGFAKNNYLGVLDHWVTINGETFYNPMRVIEDGTGSEVVFTLRGTPDIDPADEAAIRADLATLKHVLEQGTAS